MLVVIIVGQAAHYMTRTNTRSEFVVFDKTFKTVIEEQNLITTIHW